MIKVFIKYTAASFIALLFDYSGFIILNGLLGFDAPNAAVISYVFGLIVAYFLLISLVFKKRKFENNKFLEILLFIVSGILGIWITYATVRVCVEFELSPYISKLLAVVTSFTGVYGFRNLFVFCRK